MTAALLVLFFLAGILLFVGWAVAVSQRAESRILSLLAENKDRFLPGRVIASLAHVQAGVQYAHLARLEERGLVRSEIDPVVPVYPEQLPQRLYQITAAGLDELAHAHANDKKERS